MTHEHPRSNLRGFFIGTMSDSHPAAEIRIDEGELFCPFCGYDLQGISSDRCPECGREIDRASLAASKIPWVHRRHLGRVRSFWKTVRMATVRPEEIGAECARPVSYADALRFRLAVVLTAWVPVAAGVMAWSTVPALRKYVMITFFGLWALHDGPTLHSPASLILSLLWLLLWLWCASGMATWWFSPRGLTVVRQNRAVAASQYAVAPLALLPLALFLVIAVGAGITLLVPRKDFAEALDGDTMFRAAWMAAWLPVYLVPVLWWATTLRLLLRAADAGWARLVSAAVFVPILVIGFGAASFIALHALVNFVVLVITHW